MAAETDGPATTADVMAVAGLGVRPAQQVMGFFGRPVRGCGKVTREGSRCGISGSAKCCILTTCAVRWQGM